MRGLGTFLAGVCFAAYVLVWSAPVLVALSLLGGLGGRFNLFEAVSGESVFGVRERDGQLQARMVNVNFHIAMVPIADEPRPRRLLLRLETVDVDVFDASRGEGQVRLDAWAMDGGRDMLRTPLYTVVAAGDDAGIEDDSLLVVSRGARRTAYALVSGRWLYEADGAVATFALEGERRLVAVAAADEEMPVEAVAVVSYASIQAPLRRLLIVAADPSRARLLRSAVSLIRPVARLEDATHRWIDLALPAGTVRIPMASGTLDLARAEIPAGLALREMLPWGK